jgi:hypothetical protein
MKDYLAEFSAVVAAHPMDGTTARIAASEIVAQLRKENPRLLRGWLDLHAETFVTRYIGDECRSLRSYAVSQRARSVFGEALDSEEPEDRLFDLLYVVNEEKLRKRLADMTKSDHIFVAEKHEQRSKKSLLEAAFHRALAKRIAKGKTTADVMTEDQCRTLHESLESD